MGGSRPADGTIGDEMTTAHSVAVSALEAAFESGNENLLVEELRNISSQRSRREGRITLVARILEQTGSPRVRNAAALALADMRARDAKNALIDVLKRPDTKGCRSTLLYALGELDATLPISLLVDIIIGDSYEAREEALNFIANRRFDRDEDPRQSRYRLIAAFTPAGEERSHSIGAALEYLAIDGSSLQERYDLMEKERKWMGKDRLKLSPVSAPDYPKLSAHEYQSECQEFHDLLQAATIEVSPRWRTRDSIVGAGGFAGSFFVPLAKAAIPTLGAVLVAWLKGRSGRRVRLEFDGVKAEGGTPEEVETLLKHAAEFRDNKQKSDRDA